ncbi:cupin domain-containing protein [Corallococcus carmarthensis]|uniref:Cupin domain-containing protein n=1 Tax=Corallococcus carmarthensis TaxID=2316728 RepID=A0A3A8KGW9_9BACT|nr:cupin domain-containing protein [Corallococcus carmarthensis]NOK15695.1 cupin domain-containing protein [Corallococcus carmarthensis]RKH07383.1 cupin domain-containing protein [Corallococcus carmarthensis]
MGVDAKHPSASVPFESADFDEAGLRVEKVDMKALRACAPAFKMSRFTIKPGGHSALDCHEDQELWFIAAGEGELTRHGGEVTSVRPGDIIELGSNISHTLRNTGEGELRVFSVWWM